jgi:hypothetical protein
MVIVAALFVDPRGPYPSMPGVDAWDETRDARLYAGPHPVVAHPPCGPWGAMAPFSRDQSAELGPIAVEQVRRFGGVLEHPAHSKLWRHCMLPRPGELPDAHGGITIEVNQCDWGHVARKTTWLYLVSVGLRQYPRVPKCEPTHWICGRHGARNAEWKSGGTVPAHIKLCSAGQRRRTPEPFAEFLVELARQATAPRMVAAV